jgi:hypothetical protein
VFLAIHIKRYTRHESLLCLWQSSKSEIRIAKSELEENVSNIKSVDELSEGVSPPNDATTDLYHINFRHIGKGCYADLPDRDRWRCAVILA